MDSHLFYPGSSGAQYDTFLLARREFLLISDYVSCKQGYKVLWNLYKPCTYNGCQIFLLFHTLQIVIK
jgi:hypothetical protein